MKLPVVISAAIMMNMLSSLGCAAATCESLTALKLPDTAIRFAQTVAAGALNPRSSFPAPGPRGGLTFVSAKDLPEFCRVAAVTRPSTDSEIKFEVWMPTANWNSKFMGLGNGGMAGSISYASMAAAISRGYATSSTDTGHEGPNNDGSYALGHREKVIDFGYRAVHEMTLVAKVIIAAYYGRAPAFSYWNGCSTGGRQALTEAQRFPADYDGIVAGAPASYVTRLQAIQIQIAQATHRDEASYIPPAKYAVIHQAVLDKCDALDGVKDGVLENPTRCKFDPKVLECKGTDKPACLTAPQVELVKKVYGGLVSVRTGLSIFPGIQPGSELGWQMLSGPRPMDYAVDMYKVAAFHDPQWDYLKFDPDVDVERAEKQIGALMNAIDPNIRP